jgi:hypothetical protein
MKIVPPSLNIPLERKERWGLRLCAASALVIAIAALVSPAFISPRKVSCEVNEDRD